MNPFQHLFHQINFHVIMICFVFLVSTVAQSQQIDLVAGAGVSYFMGDLGGSKYEGKFGPKDLDFRSMRWVIQGGIRVTVSDYFSLRGNLAGGVLSGNDEFSKNDIRYDRSLAFRSPFIELSAICEFYFRKERTMGIYRRNTSRLGIKPNLFNMDYYGFIGIGGNWFNPQGKYQGQWYNLQPLGTEGQGIDGSGKTPYSRTAVVVPFGMGMQKKINRDISLNVEFGYRFTNSDYMDDVSGNYYDNAKIYEERGEIAAYFANPSDNFVDVTYNPDGSVAEYQKRGNPNNDDGYGFITFSVVYTLKKRIPIRRF